MLSNPAVALAVDQALLAKQVEEWQRSFRNFFLLSGGALIKKGALVIDTITPLNAALQAADNLTSPFTVRQSPWMPLKEGVLFGMRLGYDPTWDGKQYLALKFEDGTPDWDFVVGRDARTLIRYLEIDTTGFAV